MPSVPIEMPSLTPIVLNRIPTHPPAVTPALTWSASLFRCMLHGFPSYQTLAIPTCGLSRSAADRPVASSIACDAPWIAGWVIRDEYGLGTFDVPAAGVGGGMVCVAIIELHKPRAAERVTGDRGPDHIPAGRPAPPGRLWAGGKTFRT